MKRFFGCAGALFAVTCFAACASDRTQTAAPTAASPEALSRVVQDPAPAATDTFEVFVCAVPATTADPLYGDLPLRLGLVPAEIAEQMNAGVAPYFDDLSHGRYRPRFVPASTIELTSTQTHEACVDRALDLSAAGSTAVMVVATAEHIATAPGGWGRQGTPCNSDPCSASITRRALYIGASDFHPDWGAPLLDLIEHEIGHTLGLPHSGDGALDEDQHSSALDVMSNSAAPRELQGREGSAELRRDAQDTIAINRLALGWLELDDVAVTEPDGGIYELSPSTGLDGTRMLVLPIDDWSFLTIEYLTADGLNDFLPSSGLAVHRISDAPGGCGQPASDPAPCRGTDRVQLTIGNVAPHIDLLDVVGESWASDGWTITVASAVEGTAEFPADDTAAQLGVEVRATER